MAGLATMTVQSARNGVWLVIFLATPAARWLTGSREWRLRLPAKLTAAVAAVFVCLLALGLASTPTPSAASVELRAKAAAAAHGRPILADDLNAEALAVDGREVWIANPLDAFPKPDQRHYLDWTAGRASGDLLLRAIPRRPRHEGQRRSPSAQAHRRMEGGCSRRPGRSLRQARALKIALATPSEPDRLAAPELELVESGARDERDDLTAVVRVQLDLRLAAEHGHRGRSSRAYRRSRRRPRSRPRAGGRGRRRPRSRPRRTACTNSVLGAS